MSTYRKSKDKEAVKKRAGKEAEQALSDSYGEKEKKGKKKKRPLSTLTNWIKPKTKKPTPTAIAAEKEVMASSNKKTSKASKILRLLKIKKKKAESKIQFNEVYEENPKPKIHKKQKFSTGFKPKNTNNKRDKRLGVQKGFETYNVRKNNVFVSHHYEAIDSQQHRGNFATEIALQGHQSKGHIDTKTRNKRDWAPTTQIRHEEGFPASNKDVIKNTKVTRRDGPPAATFDTVCNNNPENIRHIAKETGRATIGSVKGTVYPSEVNGNAGYGILGDGQQRFEGYHPNGKPMNRKEMKALGFKLSQNRTEIELVNNTLTNTPTGNKLSRKRSNSGVTKISKAVPSIPKTAAKKIRRRL